MFKSWTICPRYQVIHRPWQKVPVFVLSQLEMVLQPSTSGHPEVTFRRAVRLPCVRRMATAWVLSLPWLSSADEVKEQ